MWLETKLRAEHWTLEQQPKEGPGEERGQEPGEGPVASRTWRAAIALRGRGEPTVGEARRLSAAGRTFAFVPSDAWGETGGEPESFTVRHDLGPDGSVVAATVLVRTAVDGRPPDRATLRIFAGGANVRQPGRVTGRRLSGAGFPVWPQRPVRRSIELGAKRVLRLTTSFEPALLGVRGTAEVRVSLDGRELLRESWENRADAEPRSHGLVLPEASEKPHGRLRFEVSGLFGYVTVHAPRVGPLEVGRYDARPWGKSKPHVVVFLADTFRADNMRLYGSALPLTPFLDRLAETALVFEQAWSVATNTMPAHVAIFSGLYARQTSAFTTWSALPDEVETIAERFASLGYRTGAITDGVVVSHENNLHQGFEWFDEREGKIEDTLPRVARFLDDDDGRPVFLFVQSYHAHTPYVVDEAVRQRLRGELDVPRPFLLVKPEVDALRAEHGPQAADWPAELRAREQSLARELLALYRLGAAGLDAGVERLHADLERRGLLRDGWFVFTSDHGEAFAEHDKVFHGGKVWGETTRIPLFLTGPGVAPGSVPHPVSLIDVAPTLAAMVGLDTSGYLGTPLFEIDQDRPVFVFQNREFDESTFAVIEDGRKVMGYETPPLRDQGQPFAAFDLNVDPLEANDVLSTGSGWPTTLLERMLPAVEELTTPRYGAQAAPIDPERAAELDALGYGQGG